MNYDMTLVDKDGKQRNFDLKDLSFLMSLMKIFLLAAFEANSELTYDIPMIRKGSNVSVDEEVNDKGESQFKTKLRNLMEVNG